MLHALITCCLSIESSFARKYDASCSFVSNCRNMPTGVTGFVGSVVLEQILRVSPSVKRIYVIIREKKGMTGTSCPAADGFRNTLERLEACASLP